MQNIAEQATTRNISSGCLHLHPLCHPVQEVSSPIYFRISVVVWRAFWQLADSYGEEDTGEQLAGVGARASGLAILGRVLGKSTIKSIILAFIAISKYTKSPSTVEVDKSKRKRRLLRSGTHRPK